MISAKGRPIAIMNFPANGILPARPSIAIDAPEMTIIVIGIAGAVRKPPSFFQLNFIASVNPGFSPRENSSAASRHIAPPEKDIATIEKVRKVIE